MKKLFISVIIMFAFNAHAFVGNIGRSTSLDYAGAVIAETVEKVFIYVKSSAAIAAGQVASLDLTSDDGATALVGPTTGLAPVCVMVNTCASGALCKCQTYGLLDTALFDATGGVSVAGKRAFMSTNNAGYASARATDLATEVALGYFYDAVSASGAVQLFIKL